MEIQDHEPRAWFLVEHEHSLLLDANCSHGAANYSFAMELNLRERTEYIARGRDFLHELAHAVHYSSPGVSGSTSAYRHRALDPDVRRAMNEAILQWVRSRHVL